MFGKLTAIILRHRPLILALLVVFILAGVNAYERLPVEAYPDVSNLRIQVQTLWPGHAAEEVEQQVTIPIEAVMNGVPGRLSMRSISLFGLSQISLIFEDNADPVAARNLVSQLLSTVNLPTGANTGLSPDATPIGEIFRYTLRAPPGFPPEELRAIEDWVVEKKFRSVPGVVDLNPFGGLTKQYQVLVDPAKLKSYGLGLQQVFNVLQNGNVNSGGGYVEHGAQLYIIRGLGLIKNVDDIKDIAVTTVNGTPVFIKDIGQVIIGHATRLGRVGRTDCIDGKVTRDEDDVPENIVIMRRGENPTVVCRAVEQMAKDINAHYLPAGVTLAVYYDRTALVDRTVHTVHKNLAEGIALVLTVTLLFLGLGNWRSALVVALAVPVSLLGAYMLLDLRGIPANLISLGAIDFGIIVDSSVVIMENLLRILHERKEKLRSLPRAITEAVAQMGRPVLFSKVILLTAFIPLYTLQQVEGRIFKPMAWTLTFALVAGTVFALLVAPVLATFAVRGGRIAGEESRIVRWLLRVYRPLLDYALRSRALVLAGAAALLVVGGIVFHFLGSEFLPKLDEGDLWVRTYLPQSISPSEAAKITHQVRLLLASFPEVRCIVDQEGMPDDGSDVNGWDVTEYSVSLIPRERWTTAHDREALCDTMSRKLAAIPGIQTQFSQYIEDNVDEAVSGVKANLAIKVFGPDTYVLQKLADQIVEVVSKVPGAADVGTEHLTGQPQIQITVNRAAIARYGLAMADLQNIVATALGGQAATRVLEGERSFDLVVKMSQQAVADVQSIRSLPVFGANGERITLGDLADVKASPGMARIYREENERRTDIKLSVRNRDMGSLVADAQRDIQAQVKVPPGYRVSWTGAFENEQRAERRLAIIFPITLLAIFFLLFVTFDSSALAALILLIVPCTAVGGILALPVAGLNLSVAALVGFVALFGIAIQNCVILISRIRELRKTGLGMATAVREGAAQRVRPMVMTALMAMLGLLPAAISTGVGAETARPFAVVIIGGLLTGTAITLFLVPALYPWFDGRSLDQP